MSCINILSSDQDDSLHLEVIEKQPLAFSAAENLISATCRLPFVTEDKSAALNVECFFFQDLDETEEEAHFREIEGNNEGSKRKVSPLFLFVHGICASTETVGVQHIVKEARRKRYRVAVLELEGHGLSSGERAVCGDFQRLVGHVTQFVKHVLTQITRMEKCKTIPFILSGNSLGGTLVAYAADIVSKSLAQYPGRFLGVALIGPAVGVNQETIPSPIATNALRLLSCLAPSASVSLTPMADPITYSAPKNSTRNYHGHWPLATSRMLLDVSNEMVKKDVENGILTMNKVNSLILFAGLKDEIVPFAAVKEFFESIKAREKALISVPEEGHDLMYQAVSATEIVNQIFQWMELRMWAIERAN